MIQATDGALYGTSGGGTYGFGTLFKLSPDGTGFTVLANLDGATTGGYPGGLIQATDGALYGTTSYGGSYNYGTVFKLNTDGTGFSVLTNFNSSSHYGGSPPGDLIQGTDGALYGTTVGLGSFGWGTVFKLNTDGTGFTVLMDFDFSTTGGNPTGLIQGTDGALYGAASRGDSYGVNYDYGLLFKLNTDGTGFTVLWTFDRLQGAYPRGKLMQGSDGAFYGVAEQDIYNSGVLFKLDGTGFSVLRYFSGFLGGFPEAGLIQGTDGAIYGTTYGLGSLGYGTLFKLNTNGTGFTVLLDFDGSIMGANARAQLLQGSDGALYGTATAGGSGGGNGTVFKLNTDGSGSAVLSNFDTSTNGDNPYSGLMQASDGVLYGTTCFGGSNGFGTVFKLNPDGTGFGSLANLDNTTTGGNPAGLIQGTDGALYGTASRGGSNGFGTVFKLNTDGTAFTVLMDFDSSTTGAHPVSGLIQASDGKLYGTARDGGSHGFGTVFKLNQHGTGFTVLLDFDGVNTGAGPLAGLIQGTDGALYGAAATGGSNDSSGRGIGDGTVFKLNRDGTGFTVLQNLDLLAKGRSPIGLMQAADGALYGTAARGGPYTYFVTWFGRKYEIDSWGTAFRLNTDGTGFSVLHNFDWISGANPSCALMQGTDGALYGTTSYAGTNGEGTAFKLSPDGTGFAVLVNSGGSTTGAHPYAGLMQGTDRNLYGTTVGDTFTGGTLFRLILYSASWSNYGTGLAGTNGIPILTSDTNPVLGTTITLTFMNSLGSDTSAFLLAGLSRASIPFKSGRLLVGDMILLEPLWIPASGRSLRRAIPDEPSLCGLDFDFQALEIDPGAAQGVSFTPGLELTLGW